MTLAGVPLGLAVYLAAAATGLAELAIAQPMVFSVLRWAGVAYLLWLAVDTWRGKSAGPEGAPIVPTGRLLARGFLTNLLNPKAAVFYLAMQLRGAFAAGLVGVALWVAWSTRVG